MAVSTDREQGGDGAGTESGDWWTTGTRYALQPRLSADKPTATSFNPNGDDIGRIGGGSRDGGDGGGDGDGTGGGGGGGGGGDLSGPTSAASAGRRGSDFRALTMLRLKREEKQHQEDQEQQQQQQGQGQQKDGWRGNGSRTAAGVGVMRVVQPAQSNADCGQRVFYLP